MRDWNLDQPDTWGAVGHFSIASRVVGALSGDNHKLTELMTNNAALIAPDDETIRNAEFKGMGSQAFVHLADVPDFYWKHGHQGHARPFEGPNHFADMDQKNNAGEDLLALCKVPTNIDADAWNAFYDSVRDLLSGDPIEAKHRGLLPFRVWQIFDEMVKFAAAGQADEFVCAAGVLTHYVADACQPLHVSYLHDGDPLRPVTRTVHHRNGTVEDVQDPLGKGVHAAYEDEMINANRGQILDELALTAKVVTGELIGNGFSAAKLTIELMRSTFKSLPPSEIVRAFIDYSGKPKDRAEAFWRQFGTKTIEVMQLGTHLLAVLWESAWVEGGGEGKVESTEALTEEKAMEVCARTDFLESFTIGAIGAHLQRPGG